MPVEYEAKVLEVDPAAVAETILGLGGRRVAGREVAATLGYSEHRLTGENTTKVYARYGINLPDIPDLRFTAT